MSQNFENIMKLEIPFTGHKHVLSLHEKTLEITKDKELTPQGDCIVGVNSEKAHAKACKRHSTS